MASERIVKNIQEWFKSYTKSFISKSTLIDEAINLKISHTFRVCNNSDILCAALKADSEIVLISKIVALLHDIGRFYQFQKYSTFADNKSVNHAHLAIEIIDKHALLSNLSSTQTSLIKTAINLHNVQELPSDLTERERLFCNLIRDADKIDIYKIAAEHYSNSNQIKNEIIGFGIQDIPEVSDEVCETIYNRKSVPFSIMRSFNDFKLVQIGWVFDFNFPISLYLIKTRKHYDTIKKHLPNDSKVKSVIELVDRYLEEQLRSISESEISICNMLDK